MFRMFRGSSAAILASAAFLCVVYNLAFFRNVQDVYPVQENLAFYLAMALLMFSLLGVFLSLVLNKLTLKPVLMLLLPVSAIAAYFMDSYNVVIDSSMLRNALMTDSRETGDLLSLRMLMYLLILGLIPAWVVYRWTPRCQPLREELSNRAKLILLLLALSGGNVMAFSEDYAVFVREHKDLRYYANPLTVIYSASKLLEEELEVPANATRLPIGRDARVTRDDARRKLFVLVVGEAARGDHWRLNGYERDTNPQLAAQQVISFPRVASCATSTAYSLPCMFSLIEHDDFELKRTLAQENLLDVLAHTGARVLWRDNNSDSKGVATAIPFEDFRSPDVNPVCDVECRDIGMLAGLEDVIQSTPEGDIVIVLHQMGNHGPAYFKRYPAEFERFTPVCETNDLSECSTDEVRNAYDNALLYTDHFLSQVIEFLKPWEGAFATSMLYMSDHGESLGEYGVYLHGLPYALAPEAQTHVSTFYWQGQSLADAEREALAAVQARQWNHDALFHTVLGLLDVSTSVYKPGLDMLGRLTY